MQRHETNFGAKCETADGFSAPRRPLHPSGDDRCRAALREARDEPVARLQRGGVLDDRAVRRRRQRVAAFQDAIRRIGRKLRLGLLEARDGALKAERQRGPETRRQPLISPSTTMRANGFSRAARIPSVSEVTV